VSLFACNIGVDGGQQTRGTLAMLAQWISLAAQENPWVRKG